METYVSYPYPYLTISREADRPAKEGACWHCVTRGSDGGACYARGKQGGGLKAGSSWPHQLMSVSRRLQAFTSNQPPEDLYLGGLNRKYFMPFVNLVRDCCLVHQVYSGVGVPLPRTRSNPWKFCKASCTAVLPLSSHFPHAQPARHVPVGPRSNSCSCLAPVHSFLFAPLLLHSSADALSSSLPLLSVDVLPPTFCPHQHPQLGIWSFRKDS